MAKIKNIEVNEVLGAKGLPTVEVTVMLSDGKIGTSSCPTGEQIGLSESSISKDNESKRIGGQVVSAVIENIKYDISPSLIGKEADHQSEIDRAMIALDGTPDKSRLGANAMFTVSMAVAKAAAESSSLPLFMYLRQFVKNEHQAIKIPIPIFNFINGKNKDALADFYEFLVVPASSKPYLECIKIGEEITKSLRQIIESRYATALSNDYADGFVLDLATNREAFSLIEQAIGATSIGLGFDVFFGLNSRASTFFRDGKYHIKDALSGLSSKEMINYYLELNKNIHLLYLEDPLDQNDWEGWSDLFKNMSGATIIAGGDLIATNPGRLQMAIDKKTVNAVLIKPNQIGTVTESLEIAETAKASNLKIIVSHRSNETNDDFLSDFSVAVSADYIKVGSLSRGENVAKYNRLLQIENQLKIL
jgi:enolase